MTQVHTVLFTFKSSASDDQVKDACKQFITLKDKCIHPTSQAPYILSLKAGRDNSEEDCQEGLTHAFVVEFASAEDRDYYTHKDPAHQDLIRAMDPLIERAVAVDFLDGVF
ncbi:stress responsive A/B barrel domain-containing protein [Pyricularia oryzae 70-15]|uniref:Stress responsive A/B barrel domain-containing protein n=3 Tax=Pyricularia oryzae TaxID=318829 RepID=G4MPY9_PYRO7|nr:stress responsive A/B barrel domain-containing protein [Pyricularia oryzae 70-15]EHA58077.1 stress responsive A/B barrel domain-containing protein [Pyricularia oryzae 70-15]ELQ37932.1 stress responsive A/B barrel domain-containing protein [Pyricularia oryzae Y34]KAI7923472.1 stress responsive A/B barrel domain-containing protein [Pyricularia oryzae]KAI7928103.1 stress responsive A/B barrel domain-containing protein [Pyricularia oryzae]